MSRLRVISFRWYSTPSSQPASTGSHNYPGLVVERPSPTGLPALHSGGQADPTGLGDFLDDLLPTARQLPGQSVQPVRPAALLGSPVAASLRLRLRAACLADPTSTTGRDRAVGTVWGSFCCQASNRALPDTTSLAQRPAIGRITVVSPETERAGNQRQGTATTQVDVPEC